MSRLGQFDDFGDWSTDVFDWGAVDYDWGWETFDLPDTYFGADEIFSYDMPTTDVIGYDVADPLFGDPYMDAVYDPALTMADDYGDLYAPPEYSMADFDPATGVGIGDDAVDWAAWEDSGAAELEAATGGSVDTAIAAFSADEPGVDWKYWADKGEDVYKLYQKMQSPTGAKPGAARPTYMTDPQTGKPVLAIVDPRTGKLVPAVRDPRTGQLVPASSVQQAGIIPGVPNALLLAGAGLAAFFLFR